MKCDICERYNCTTQIIEDNVVCEDCYFQIYGKSMLHQCYDRKVEVGRTIIWIKDEKVKCAWCEDGRTALYVSDLQDWDIFSAVMETVNRAKKTHCSECGKVIGHYYGQHFAGRFCNECWERYKRVNWNKCGMCNKPLYKCAC